MEVFYAYENSIGQVVSFIVLTVQDATCEISQNCFEHFSDCINKQNVRYRSKNNPKVIH